MNPAAPHDAERRIDNIEFNVADIARSKRFYGEVFGWHSRTTARPTPSSTTAV